MNVAFPDRPRRAARIAGATTLALGVALAIAMVVTPPAASPPPPDPYADLPWPDEEERVVMVQVRDIRRELAISLAAPSAPSYVYRPICGRLYADSWIDDAEIELGAVADQSC